MNMPFRLPKSINQNPWLSPLTAACCLETLGSSTTMSLTFEHPIVVMPSLRGVDPPSVFPPLTNRMAGGIRFIGWSLVVGKFIT